MENKENDIIRLEHEEDSLPSIPHSHHGEHHHSHHSHHSSHSHHHHHSSSHKGKKSFGNKKLKHFFKKNKYKLSNILIAVLFAIILILLGFMLDKKDFSGSDDNGGNSMSNGIVSTDSTLLIEIPVFDEEVVLVSPAVTKYINSEISVSASDIYKEYSSLGRLDKGMPVTLWYKIKGIPMGYSIRSAELLVSDNNEFKSPVVYSLSGDETKVDVYNLKTNTQYYFRFVLALSNGSKSSVEGSFKTAESPRLLSVDGMCNMRDIGGWKTLDGRKIRQGLLYRSAELDGAVDSKYTITPDGVNTMLTVLGIRTDMDLRAESDNVNSIHALGAGVKHTYYNAQMYSDVFSTNGKESTRKIFSALADKNNYPVLLHCTHGLERTGTICYLLEALLGVSQDDMMRDYQLSAMYHGGLWSLNQMNEFVGRLKSYEGANMQQKAENYLLSTGVTSAEIASIRSIFLEA